MELMANLDTLILDADAMQVQMIWRCLTHLRDGPLDLTALRVRCETLPEALSDRVGGPASETRS
jgi:hypothetical protein